MNDEEHAIWRDADDITRGNVLHCSCGGKWHIQKSLAAFAHVTTLWEPQNDAARECPYVKRILEQRARELQR